MAGLQAFTSTGVAQRLLADSHWLPALADSAIAAAIVLFAIGNMSSPSLRRRWLICAAVAALGGFSVGHQLSDLAQFAGRHAGIATAAFNVGSIVGSVVSFLFTVAVVRLLFDPILGPPFGVVVLSVLVGQTGWFWMLDRNAALGNEFAHALAAGPSFESGLVALRWLLPTLMVGAIGIFLPWDFGGKPVRSLRAALFEGRNGRQAAGPDERPEG
jgi:hypothetical protein